MAFLRPTTTNNAVRDFRDRGGPLAAKFKAERQPAARKLLDRRGSASHSLGHTPSHILRHSLGSIVPPTRAGPVELEVLNECSFDISELLALGRPRSARPGFCFLGSGLRRNHGRCHTAVRPFEISRAE